MGGHELDETIKKYEIDIANIKNKHASDKA